MMVNGQVPHLAKRPLNKSLNFIFPTKYVTPKSLKVSHRLSELPFLQSLFRIYMDLKAIQQPTEISELLMLLFKISKLRPGFK